MSARTMLRIALVAAMLAFVTGSAVAQTVRTTKAVFSPNEPIVLEYSGLPGNAQDWTTVVKRGERDDTYGQWAFTGGKRSGTMEFQGEAAGEYEVRLYFDWPAGGYNVQARYPFSVGAALSPGGKGPLARSEYAYAQKRVYAPNEPIVIEYRGLPGNAQDWIAVVKRGDPDNTHGEWAYTEGKRTGTWNVRGLPAGEYEVRVYFDWPTGSYTVQSRAPFTVGTRPADAPDDVVLARPLATTTKPQYSAGESVVLQYSGLPGNAQDWITVVKAGDPPDTHGTWQYTGGKRSGTIDVGRLSPGQYEVRVYFNWPDGGYQIQSRYQFSVR